MWLNSMSWREGFQVQIGGRENYPLCSVFYLFIIIIIIIIITIIITSETGK